MRKILLILSIIMVVTALVAACAEPAATPAPAPTPAPTPTPAPEQPEVIELLFSHEVPEPVDIAQASKDWCEKIEEMSGGRVKFVYYWASTLMPQEEQWPGVQSGVADVAYSALETDNYQTLSKFMVLPFMGFPSGDAGAKIYRQVYDKFPEVREQFMGIKVAYMGAMPGSHLHTVDKEVRVPADLKGMKIRTSGLIAEMFSQMGAAAVDVPITDMYMALERGMVEGVADHFGVMNVFGCLPLVNYHSIFGNAGIEFKIQTHIICPETWNNLPPDIQKIIDDLEPWLYDRMLSVTATETEALINNVKEMGHTVTYLTPEEIQLWADAAAFTHEAWIEEMEASGLPGRAVYEEAKRLIAEYPAE